MTVESWFESSFNHTSRIVICTLLVEGHEYESALHSQCGVYVCVCVYYRESVCTCVRDTVSV